MTYCRICDKRQATTYMPWTRRPCCEKCLAAVVKVIAQYRLTEAREYLNLKDAMNRHPAGKARTRYFYRAGFREPTKADLN